MKHFKDRNGKLSTKRINGTLIIINGLLMAWFSIIIRAIVFFKLIEAAEDMEFVIDTTLILGVVTAGVGLLVGTVGEKQNRVYKEEEEEEEFFNKNDREV
jgi:hypothetical protein